MAEELKTPATANVIDAKGAETSDISENAKTTNIQGPAREKKSKFLQYKGYPLVRNKDQIYYGNMSDKYVIWMQITEKTKIGDLEVASKIQIYKMATEEGLDPMKAITKKSEKNSLYEALDIAYAWLTRN